MKNTIDWIIRITAALILLQTLFFKYTGAEESIYIFQQMGMEPWGRYLIASLELIGAIAILIPSTSLAGALLVAGIMGGAIVSHLTRLGIVINNDGGLLFGLAITVTACSAATLFSRKSEILRFLHRLKGINS